MRVAGYLGAAGLQLGLGVGLGGLIGSWADGKLGTGFVLTIVGVVAGFAGGLLTMLRTLKRVT